jgi:hypothetical protein
MTTELQASRTLVKSTPELWAECSDAASLARHLDQFGEIRITRLEPETAVAWEGEAVSGTVRLEPSGWGTRVIMTARQRATEAEADPSPADEQLPLALQEPPAREPQPLAAEREEPPPQEPEPRPQPDPLPATAPTKPGLFARLMRLFKPDPDPDAASTRDRPAEAPEAGEPPQPEPPLEPPRGPEAALTAALDSLGRAHHRPFSRA